MADEWSSILPYSSTCSLHFILLDDEKDLAVINNDRWDEDNEVLDDWDIEEPVTKPAEQRPKPASAKPSKKNIVAPTQPPHTIVLNETEQERKARLEKLIRERDLDSAMSLFGLENKGVQQDTSSSSPIKQQTSSLPGGAFEAANPTTVPEFDQLTLLISKKLITLEGSRHYPQFLEGLVTSLLGRRDAPEIRKVAGVLSDMATVKAKEKAAAALAHGGVKGKAASAVSLKATKSSKGSGRFDDCFTYADDRDYFDDEP